MCKAIQDLQDDARAEGREEGRDEKQDEIVKFILKQQAAGVPAEKIIQEITKNSRRRSLFRFRKKAN